MGGTGARDTSVRGTGVKGTGVRDTGVRGTTVRDTSALGIGVHFTDHYCHISSSRVRQLTLT